MIAAFNLARYQTGFGPGRHPERQRHAGLVLAQWCSRPFTFRRFRSRSTVLWWLLFTAIERTCCSRPRSQLIFAVGGDADSARAVGVR